MPITVIMRPEFSRRACPALPIAVLALVIAVDPLCGQEPPPIEGIDPVAAEQQADEARRGDAFAAGLATLVGIALVGLLLLIMVVVFGARIRRIAHTERSEHRAADAPVPTAPPPADEPEPQAPQEGEADAEPASNAHGNEDGQ